MNSKISGSSQIPTKHADPSSMESTSASTMAMICHSGDVPQMKAWLDGVKDPPSQTEMLIAACLAKNAPIVQFLLDKFPDLTTSVQLHEAALRGGVSIYSIFLELFPDLIDHSFGHAYDSIGWAVMNRDLPMLSFLLNKGSSLEFSHVCYIPVRYFYITLATHLC